MMVLRMNLKTTVSSLVPAGAGFECRDMGFRVGLLAAFLMNLAKWPEQITARFPVG
jgi:hypothetical protein